MGEGCPDEALIGISAANVIAKSKNDTEIYMENVLLKTLLIENQRSSL
jgi:hypothetical protein